MHQQSDLDGEYLWYSYLIIFKLNLDCLHVVILHTCDAIPVRAFVLTMNGQDPMLEPSCQKVELATIISSSSSPDSQTDRLTE